MTTAGLALAISLSLLVWEFAKWALEGGRVRVTLRAGHLHDFALYEASTWQSLQSHVDTQKVGGWPVEVGVIDVENAGRTAVTVSDVTFDLGRSRNRRFGFGRHTLGLQLLDAPGATQEPVVRLEPFDRARFVIEAWSVLPAARARSAEQRAAPIGSVRASVRVAGRRRLRRSSWRRAWPSRPSAVSHSPAEVDVKLAAYRVMWRRTHSGRSTDKWAEVHQIPFALAIAEAFPSTGRPPTKDDLERLFAERWVASQEQPVGLALLAYHVAEDLRMFYPNQCQANSNASPAPPVTGSDAEDFA